MTVGFGNQGLLENATWYNMAVVVVALTAGSAFLMWIGERINQNGVGNGISIVLLINIVSRMPDDFVALYTKFMSGKSVAMAVLAAVIIAAVILVTVVFVIILQDGERRIPVQYSKKLQGRKVIGGQSTNIPMKVHSAGVMPIIFAVTLLQFPGMIASFWPQSGFALWWGRWMNSATIPYNIIFAILIVALGYFYNMVTFNPVEVSKNIQQYGGFIPGIRPGKPTSDYLAKISSRLTLFGGLFLALLATLPGLIAGLVGTNIMALTATGVLISVSVALETSKQLESQMLMRHYKGFLK